MPKVTGHWTEEHKRKWIDLLDRYARHRLTLKQAVTEMVELTDLPPRLCNKILYGSRSARKSLRNARASATQKQHKGDTDGGKEEES